MISCESWFEMILDITKSKTVDLISTNNNILECMDKCIKLWTHKMDLPEALSIQWKGKVSKCIDEK